MILADKMIIQRLIVELGVLLIANSHGRAQVPEHTHSILRQAVGAHWILRNRGLSLGHKMRVVFVRSAYN